MHHTRYVVRREREREREREQWELHTNRGGEVRECYTERPIQERGIERGEKERERDIEIEGEREWKRGMGGGMRDCLPSNRFKMNLTLFLWA